MASRARRSSEKHADLDQAVGLEGGVGLLFHGRGEPVSTDHDDRIQVVGFGAVHLALGRGKLNGGHPRIIDAYTNTSMSTKAKSKKVNKSWLHDHVNDPYVKLATREGYRARAAYKLKEIDESLGLIKPGQLVVDLGSTPGAWSQYVAASMSPEGAAVGTLNGTIIALDMLPWSPSKASPSCRGTSARRSCWSSWKSAGGTQGGSGRLGHGAQPFGHPFGRRRPASRTWSSWHRLRPAPPEARRGAGGQGVPRQRL
jgi:hypothetical protein